MKIKIYILESAGKGVHGFVSLTPIYYFFAK